MEYYFPVRGERYVPQIEHALGELIDCMVHNTKLAVFSDFDLAHRFFAPRFQIATAFVLTSSRSTGILTGQIS